MKFSDNYAVIVNYSPLNVINSTKIDQQNEMENILVKYVSSFGN